MASTEVGVVALGVYRNVAAGTTPLFQGHPWRLAAVLDLQDTKYGYNTHNLAVTLRALHPSPKCFIIGLAITDDMAREAKSVFEDYVKDCGVENAHVWKLCQQDWRSEITNTLTAHYGA